MQVLKTMAANKGSKQRWQTKVTNIGDTKRWQTKVTSKVQNQLRFSHARLMHLNFVIVLPFRPKPFLLIIVPWMPVVERGDPNNQLLSQTWRLRQVTQNTFAVHHTKNFRHQSKPSANQLPYTTTKTIQYNSIYVTIRCGGCKLSLSRSFCASALILTRYNNNSYHNAQMFNTLVTTQTEASHLQFPLRSDISLFTELLPPLS